jgi:hypothetical protein
MNASPPPPLVPELLRCVICRNTVVLPLIATCGHSFACKACALQTAKANARTNVKNFKRKRGDNGGYGVCKKVACPVCGETLKTVTKLKVNRTLGDLAEQLDPTGVSGREDNRAKRAQDQLTELLKDCRRVAEETTERRRKKAHEETDTSDNPQTDNGPTYPEKWRTACETVLTQTRETTEEYEELFIAFNKRCKCNVITPPILAIKKKKWMRSCSRWRPGSTENCGTFDWVGARDLVTMGLKLGL